MKIAAVFLLCCLVLVSCNSEGSKEIEDHKEFETYTNGSPSINGKDAYLNSPFVTAGDRVYIVGHQNGSFPELGWHVKDEMGGIWDHPIKLMDGFEIVLTALGTGNSDVLSLDKAHSFTNYPYANKHSYSWPDQGLELERWQFVPDGKEGMVVQLVLKNNNEPKSYRMLFAGHVDLRPTWLGERTQMIDGTDMVDFDVKRKVIIAKDSLNPWFAIFGANQLISNDQIAGKGSYGGKGASGGLVYDISLKPNETKVIDFVIAGSYTSEENAWDTYQGLQKNYKIELVKKRQRYEALAKKSKLTIPDKDIEQAFEWVKYNCDWLVRTVPEIGSGIGAGIPDYPWWFGVDSEYSLQGYMAVGQTEAVYNTIKLLDSVSNAVNGNGQIIHEMSTNGAVFNKGNVNETPQFASLIWKIYQWNGDRQFLETYFPAVEKGLQWLMQEKDANKNGFPDGFGMMEIHGMDSEMIDVAAYTQKAFADASKMALALGKRQLSETYEITAAELKRSINIEFWSENLNSYADFIGTDQQALRLIDDAIIRADTLGKPWAVKELRETKIFIMANPSATPRPFVLHHNWVVNTPMEVKLAPKENAIKALNTAEKFVNPFGVFVTGIDRDESAGSDDGSFVGSKQFSYTGAVMTLPTGVQIVAENNYGRPDQALNYLKRMTRSFSYALPGSTYEVSPDYGMMTQAWNIYGYAVPIVEQFFGIRPDAAHKKVVIAPQMPSEWNTASLENVLVGDNEISIFYSEENGQTKVKVTQTKPHWTLEIQLPKKEKDTAILITSGETENISSDFHFIISSKGTEVILQLSGNE
jgi:glycogen debranching enzyme